MDVAANKQSEEFVDIEAERQAIAESLKGIKPDTERYASEFVDGLLGFARKIGTSDVHIQPTRTGLHVGFRRDGVLQSLGRFQVGSNSSIVARLKVLSSLLTHQFEMPQEGRFNDDAAQGTEVRVSTFPTLYGERVVLRFFGNGEQFQQLDQLGLSDAAVLAIKDAVLETTGAMMITGPAGSGKSTTLYACMRHLVQSTNGARSLVSIEDPIEVPIDGVAQSKVNNATGFDLNTGLRSILRQDPEVIMVGEIRDRSTAEIAIQASLTGQLMVTTFHADSAATGISRLIEMGIEPYLLRSGLKMVTSQRLLRRLCDCAEWSEDHEKRCGLELHDFRAPVGCARCNETGFAGRVIVSEQLSLADDHLANAVLNKVGSREIQRIAIENGLVTIRQQAVELVRAGTTSPSEVLRVLGATARHH